MAWLELGCDVGAVNAARLMREVEALHFVIDQHSHCFCCAIWVCGELGQDAKATTTKKTFIFCGVDIWLLYFLGLAEWKASRKQSWERRKEGGFLELNKVNGYLWSNHSQKLVTAWNRRVHDAYFSSVSFSLLASGSDDQHTIVWDPLHHKKLLSMHTGHTANIFSVKVFEWKD